jgi:hypothetical protein
MIFTASSSIAGSITANFPGAGEESVTDKMELSLFPWAVGVPKKENRENIPKRNIEEMMFFFDTPILPAKNCWDCLVLFILILRKRMYIFITCYYTLFRKKVNPLFFPY